MKRKPIKFNINLTQKHGLSCYNITIKLKGGRENEEHKKRDGRHLFYCD